MNVPELAPAAQPPVFNEQPFEWWQGLSRVMGSLEGLQDGRCLYTLLATFSITGLLAAVMQASLIRQDWPWTVAQGALAMFFAFYGSQAAGLQAMDRARGLPVRGLWASVQGAFGLGHRFFLVMLCGVLLAAGLLGVILGLFWLCDLPLVGPWLYAFVVPLTVVALAVIFAITTAVLLPFAGPAVWSGASTWQALRQLKFIAREHLLRSAVLMLLLTVLIAVLGAVVSAVVFVGGRMMAEVSVWLLSVDVSPGVLMAGLFGHGLHSVRLDQVPRSAVPHIVAALVGGGVVFALAVAMPTLVYLRGICEIYLLLAPSAQPE